MHFQICNITAMNFYPLISQKVKTNQIQIFYYIKETQKMKLIHIGV